MGDGSSKGEGSVAWGEVRESFSSRVSSIGSGRSDHRLWRQRNFLRFWVVFRGHQEAAATIWLGRDISSRPMSRECDLGCYLERID